MSYAVVCVFFFFFKQKTAYEMRISDWSSDVCSSDLSRSVIAGTGLSGGGPLSADVTLNLDASIDLLTDVVTSTTPPTDGQALVWNDTDSLWVPGTVSGGGGSDSGVDYFIAEKQVILPIDNRNATTNIGCAQTAAGRSDERRVGKESVRRCSSGWSRYISKKKTKETKQL